LSDLLRPSLAASTGPRWSNDGIVSVTPRFGKRPLRWSGLTEFSPISCMIFVGNQQWQSDWICRRFSALPFLVGEVGRAPGGVCAEPMRQCRWQVFSCNSWSSDRVHEKQIIA
jgi:hypothetical protein